MSVSSLQSRSSIDLQVSKSQAPASHEFAKSHPQRLQHSPSLPNIWFPPHSRPLLDMSSTTCNTPGNPNHSQKPATAASYPPPATPQHPLSKSHDDGMVPSLEKLSLSGSDTRRSTIKTTPLHTRKRQRKDRDTSQHLLTPPLTPSSSIRTTASADSTDGKPEDKVKALQELQEPEATRFLYLENVSRTVSIMPLQGVITDALSHISSRRNSKYAPQTGPTEGSIQETSCIKGFFLRHMKTTGTFFLAFHDVRDAYAAKIVLSKRTDGVLVGCLGEEKPTDGTDAWLRCRFITAEELVKTIGNSNFLATTDGGFSLTVATIDHTRTAETSGLGSTMTKQDLDAYLLTKILESYGDLRLFKSESQIDGDQCFLVEFFDVRDANEAYASLNDQTMFGMKLTTSGRVALDVQETDVSLDVPRNNSGQERSDTPMSNHQQSASESHIPRLKPGIGTAGEISQMRGRFVGRAVRARPRAVSVGNETSSSSPPPRTSNRQSKASSPTIFYTSFDFTDSHSTSWHGTHETDGQTIGNSEYNAPELGQAPKQWEPQQACSIAECRYCPSKAHDSLIVQPHFSDHINPPFANSIPFPVQSPPQIFAVPSEYNAHAPFPNVGWPFDPSIIAPATGNNLDMFTPAFIPAIPVLPAEHRYPDLNSNPNFVPNGLVFPSISPALHVQPHHFVEPRPPVVFDPHIFVNNSVEVPPSDLDASLKLATAGPGVSDRNYLNIIRIEEGLDTRTTVMIKNIPNKMTAKDLIQYISDVCPRKIDFLYLRMDFKNGCNVGYAFVNFIRVQDMLKFAKRRLGVKWNMFSSEKVLQMSYANYQGKEALVEKFKNSCIMDEREEWRPKIFYSGGPEQGLPEPFPAPTHLRRKERSSHNRGALYVPGATGGSINGTGYLNNGPLRRQEYYSPSSSKYLEHRNRGADRNVDKNVEDSRVGGRRGKLSHERTH